MSLLNIDRTATDFLYKELRERIIKGEFKPGQKISMRKITERYGCSKTPIREAFLRLNQEGLMNILPQRGSVVSKIDLDLVAEGRFVRENIEKALVKKIIYDIETDYKLKMETNLVMQYFFVKKKAYQNLYVLDEEFHRILFEVCNKIRTWNVLRQMYGQFDRSKMLTLASNQHWEMIVYQHKKLYACIIDQKLDEAIQVVIQYFNLLQVEFDRIISQYSNTLNFNKEEI